MFDPWWKQQARHICVSYYRKTESYWVLQDCKQFPPRETDKNELFLQQVHKCVLDLRKGLKKGPPALNVCCVPAYL